MTRIAPATAGLLLVVLFGEFALPSAFVTDHAVTAFPSRILRKRLSVPSAVNASTGDSRQSRDFNSRLLDDFKTATGELVNPYKILKVSRKADRTEIRNAYRSLSKAYHPDGFLQKKDKAILPGRCNNIEDIREEWERIKLSYEILSDKKMRIRFDRNSAITDPKAALGRAALDTVGWGLSSVGKSFLKAGQMAFAKEKDKNDKVGEQ